jgi:hypothetical protein
MPSKKGPKIPTGWRLRRTLRGHTIKINNLAWAPDGSWLAYSIYHYDRFGAGESFVIARGRVMCDIVLIGKR